MNNDIKEPTLAGQKNQNDTILPLVKETQQKTYSGNYSTLEH